MKRLVPHILIAGLASFGAGGSAFASDCRNDLLDAREGMIDMGGPERTEALSSREALSLLSQGGGLNFSRNVEDFWRIKVRRSVGPLDLQVKYRVEGGGDRSGPAIHRDNANQGFPVRLIPSTPRILCENATHRIISGGFTASSRVSRIGVAGVYAVEIDVDVQER